MTLDTIPGPVAPTLSALDAEHLRALTTAVEQWSDPAVLATVAAHFVQTCRERSRATTRLLTVERLAPSLRTHQRDVAQLVARGETGYVDTYATGGRAGPSYRYIAECDAVWIHTEIRDGVVRLVHTASGRVRATDGHHTRHVEGPNYARGWLSKKHAEHVLRTLAPAWKHTTTAMGVVSAVHQGRTRWLVRFDCTSGDTVWIGQRRLHCGFMRAEPRALTTYRGSYGLLAVAVREAL